MSVLFFVVKFTPILFDLFIYRLKRRTWGEWRRNVPDAPTPDVIATSTFHLGEERSDPLQSATNYSLQEESNLSEADRDAMEARGKFLEHVW